MKQQNLDKVYLASLGMKVKNKTETKPIKLKYYKNIVLDKIKTETNNPTDRKIKQWTADFIRVNSLLNVMKKENLIDIELVEDGKTVRRVLTPLVDRVSDI